MLCHIGQNSDSIYLKGFKNRKRVDINSTIMKGFVVTPFSLLNAEVSFQDLSEDR